jgi:hypothetical protein
MDNHFVELQMIEEDGKIKKADIKLTDVFSDMNRDL